MLRERSIEIALEQRRQRRAMFLFALALLILLGFCAVVGVRLLALPPDLIAVGTVDDYADGKLHRLSVPRLTVSSLITRRDETVAYVVSKQRMDAIAETLELLANPAAMKALRAARKGRARYAALDEIAAD